MPGTRRSSLCFLARFSRQSPISTFYANRLAFLFQEIIESLFKTLEKKMFQNRIHYFGDIFVEKLQGNSKNKFGFFDAQRSQGFGHGFLHI
jgi:hypothetical protein